MSNFLKRVIGFIKENPGILYSLLLIVLIPLALYWNTFFTARSFQKNIDYNLQTKALLAESIFGTFASDFLSKPETLQKKIKEVIKENPEIIKLQVILPKTKEKFKIIASKDSQEIGKDISEDYPITLAWYQNQTIANLEAEKGERFWNVVRPFYDSEGTKIGLMRISLSLKSTDALVFEILRRSYLLVILAILFTLFLIIHHTRLFGYVILSKKLKELDKMKDSFIRMATHELQSPIVNIKSYIESLKEEITPLLNKEQAKYLSRVAISTQRLSDLISDILEVSRIEQGRLDFSPEKIKPQKIIKETIDELKMKADKKGLFLIFKKKEEPFFIYVNSKRLGQILFNLIDNAIKYTFEGKVEIKTEANLIKKRYYITIQDTGIGISAEAQKRLFEKFYRVRTKRTAEISGTGLGLWIARELCQRMGGEILIESIEGAGSKFTIIFPLVK